jgi:hypothetical protein
MQIFIGVAVLFFACGICSIIGNALPSTNLSKNSEHALSATATSIPAEGVPPTVTVTLPLPVATTRLPATPLTTHPTVPPVPTATARLATATSVPLPTAVYTRPTATATPLPTAAALRPTATPTARPRPTATPTPKPQPTATSAPAYPAINNNPWDYTFADTGHLLTDPNAAVCVYLKCIPSFWKSTNGYVEQCQDAMFSHSGGVQGACSYHRGELRPVYQP